MLGRAGKETVQPKEKSKLGKDEIIWSEGGFFPRHSRTTKEINKNMGELVNEKTN